MNKTVSKDKDTEATNNMNNEMDDGLMREDGFTMVERGGKKMNAHNKANENERVLNNIEDEQTDNVVENESSFAKAETVVEKNVNEMRERHKVEYKHEWTVLIESELIDGLNVMTLIKEIEKVVGHGALLALRPKQNR